MSFKLVLFLLAALLLVSSSSVSARTWDDEKQPGPPAFSKWLVLTWPPGYCWTPRGYGCMNRIFPPIFTIHGLWPENYHNGRQWEGRSLPELNPNGISRVVKPGSQLWKHMNENWPTLNHGNNVGFWTSEWNKHGRFTRLQANQYFYKTIQIGRDLLSKLHDFQKIIPGNNGWHNKKEFIGAIAERLQITVWAIGLACNQKYSKPRNNKVGYDHDMLSEVLICIDGAKCGKQPVYQPCDGDEIWVPP